MLAKCIVAVMALGLFCSSVFALNFSGVEGNDSRGMPFTSFGDNDVSGSAASGWYFKSANVSGGEGFKDAEVSSNEKSSYTFTTEGNNFNFVTFTIVLSGNITQHGGSGGTMPTYSLTGRRYGELFITSNPESGVIPAGGTITFYGKEQFVNQEGPVGNKTCDWALQPSTYQVNGSNYTPSPLYKVEATSLTISPSSNHKTPDPGTYTVKAKASPSSEAEWKNATLTVVGVDEVQAKLRSATTYSSVSGTLYAAVGDNLSVKAIIDPTGASWPSGTPEWSTSGDEWFSSRVSGVGETKTVDTSEPEDGFTIKAKCGTSEKTIDVAVYKCEFILYVQSPYGGPVGITGLLNKDITVGHTFWQFKVSDFALSYLRNNDLQAYASSLNNKFGFYPDFSWNNPYRTSGPGKIENDNAHSYGKSKSYEINYSNLQSGLSQTHALRNSPGTYTLGTRIRITDNGIVQHDATYSSDRNCTSVAKSVGSSAGVSTPASNITGWTTTRGTLSLLFSGNNPYTLNSNM